AVATTGVLETAEARPQVNAHPGQPLVVVRASCGGTEAALYVGDRRCVRLGRRGRGERPDQLAGDVQLPWPDRTGGATVHPERKRAVGLVVERNLYDSPGRRQHQRFLDGERIEATSRGTERP